MTCQSNKAVNAVAEKLATALPGQVLVIGGEKTLLEKKCAASLANTLSVQSKAAWKEGHRGRRQKDPVDDLWREVGELDVPRLRLLLEALREDDAEPEGGGPQAGAALAAAAAELLAKCAAHVAEPEHAGRYSRGLPLRFAARWRAAHDQLRAFLDGSCPGAGASASVWSRWIEGADAVTDAILQSQTARIVGTARVWLSTIDSLPVLAEKLTEYMGGDDDSDAGSSSGSSAGGSEEEGLLVGTIIVDEAGAVAEYALPTLLNLQPENVVLVGDHFQLPPMTNIHTSCEAADGVARIDRVVTDCGHSRSTMERVADGWGRAAAAGSRRGGGALLRLETQYRMHPRICGMISSLFYGGWVHSDEGLAERRSDFCDPVTAKDPSGGILKWLDVGGKEETEKGRTSLLNLPEAYQVVEQAVEARTRVPDCSIFIISFYSAQVRAIDDVLKKLPAAKQALLKGVTVHTVDSVQGSEADVIILSIVRCNAPAGATLTFIRSRQRLNVALSRARKLLVVCGHLPTAENAAAAGPALFDYKQFRAFFTPVAPPALALPIKLGVRTLISACDMDDSDHHPADRLTATLASLVYAADEASLEAADPGHDGRALPAYLRKKLTDMKRKGAKLEKELNDAMGETRRQTVIAVRRAESPAAKALLKALQGRADDDKFYSGAVWGSVVSMSVALAAFFRNVVGAAASEAFGPESALPRWLDSYYEALSAAARNSLALFQAPTPSDPAGYGVPALADVHALNAVEGEDVKDRLRAGTLFPPAMHLAAWRRQHGASTAAAVITPDVRAQQGEALLADLVRVWHHFQVFSTPYGHAGEAPLRRLMSAGQIPFVKDPPFVEVNREVSATFPDTIGALSLIAFGTPDGFARIPALVPDAEPPAAEGGGASDSDASDSACSDSPPALALSSSSSEDASVADASPQAKASPVKGAERAVPAAVGAGAPAPPPQAGDPRGSLGSSDAPESSSASHSGLTLTPSTLSEEEEGGAEVAAERAPLVVCEIKCPMAADLEYVRLSQRAVAQAIIYQRIAAQRLGPDAPPPLAAVIQHARIAAPGSTQAKVPAAMRVFNDRDCGTLPRLDVPEAQDFSRLEVSRLPPLPDGDVQHGAQEALRAARAKLWAAFYPATGEAGEAGGGRVLLGAALAAAGPSADGEEARRVEGLSDEEVRDALRSFLCGTADGAGAEDDVDGGAALGEAVRDALDRIAVARPEGSLSVVLFSAAYSAWYWEAHVLPPLRRYLGIALDLAGRRPPGGGAWPGMHQLTAEDVAAWRGLAEDDR